MEEEPKKPTVFDGVGLPTLLVALMSLNTGMALRGHQWLAAALWALSASMWGFVLIGRVHRARGRS